MYLARAVGEYAEKGPWSGRVVSAHHGALNLLREDGLLFSVVAEEAFMTAMSVLAPTLFGPNSLAGLEDLVGRPAELRGSRLLICGHTPIELAEAKTWLGLVQGNAGKAIPAEKTLLAERALVRLGKPGGLLGVLSSGAPSGPFAAQALRALDADRPELLVGLGPGMTPAGDDFLAGALLAGRSGLNLGVSGPRIDAKAIEAALPGTASAGRTLLWLALRGSFPSYLCSFMKGLMGAGTKKEIENTVRAACSHGETSGTDALAGFFLAAGSPRGGRARLPEGRICATQGSS
jgi:hypothetical protein